MSAARSATQLAATAWHEAGHAVVGAALGRVVLSADIIPVSDRQGVVRFATVDGIVDRESSGPITLTWAQRPYDEFVYLLDQLVVVAGPTAHEHYVPGVPLTSGEIDESLRAQYEGDAYGLYGESLVELCEDLLDHHADDVRRVADLLLERRRIEGEDVAVQRCPECCAYVESIMGSARVAEMLSFEEAVVA